MQRRPLACREPLQDFRIGAHLKPGLWFRPCKTACRLRDAIRVGKVGLYVKNRRPMQQIGSRNPQQRPFRGLEHNILQLHRRQPQRIRTERGTRGKNPDPRIAA